MRSAEPDLENAPAKLSAKTMLGLAALLAACVAYLWFMLGVFTLDSFGFALQLHFVLMFAAANLDQVFKPSLDSPRFRVRLAESTQRRYDKAAREVVDHLLFRGEVALTAPIVGTSGFAEAYAAAGKRDSKGRSLRDFDLEPRLFKYPCSDAIYSEAFDALPGPVLEAVWRELGPVLRGEDVGRDFSHLSRRDCESIILVLTGTEAEVPED